KQLVPRPVPNMGCGYVADVIHIEEDQGAYLRAVQSLPNLPRPVRSEPSKVNPLLPIRPQCRPRGCDSHGLRGSVVILDHGYLLGTHHHGTTSRFFISPRWGRGPGWDYARSAPLLYARCAPPHPRLGLLVAGRLLPL